MIPNGYDPEDIADIKIMGKKQSKKFRIVYIGNFYRSVIEKDDNIVNTIVSRLTYSPRKLRWDTYSPRYLLESARMLESTGRIPKDIFQFEFAGGNKKDIEMLAYKLGMNNRIVHHGYIAYQKALTLAAEADLLFIALPFSENVDEQFYWVPQKTYELLALGRPFIAFVPKGDARDIICKCNGIVVDRPWDLNKLGNSLEKLVFRRTDKYTFNDAIVESDNNIVQNKLARFSYPNLANALMILLENLC
jgi:hypothetical protein